MASKNRTSTAEYSLYSKAETLKARFRNTQKERGAGIHGKTWGEGASHLLELDKLGTSCLQLQLTAGVVAAAANAGALMERHELPGRHLLHIMG
jgi:hypothetical protein